MKKYLNQKSLILVCLSLFIFGNLNLKPSLASSVDDTYSLSDSKYVDGEILVKYKDSVGLNTKLNKPRFLDFVKSTELEVEENIKENNISILKITDKSSVEDKIAELRNNPSVEYVQPNYQYYSTNINTNDSDKDLLWGLDNIGQAVNGMAGTNGSDVNAPEAWQINEGENPTPVVVAVIDTGVAYLHSDLINSMWDGSNCKDENGNFLGDCLHGYDYEDNDKEPLPTLYYHGTLLAGIIAAEKNNNIGVIGVAPHSKIMAIKTSLTTVDNIKSINFAKQNGAKIINASWGGFSNDLLLKDAIAAFPGLFIAAAGNCGDDNYLANGCPSKNQTFYPASFDLDNIISVAATDQNDNLASFSNSDTTSVDVGAPGKNIYSTLTVTGDGSDNLYGYSNGTSMSASFVAGLAALVEGYNPNLTSVQVKNAILNSGDSLNSLQSKTVSGKRINAQKTLEAVNPIKKITSFSFVDPMVEGSVNEDNHTVTVSVPFGTDVTNLTPVITINGLSINPNSDLAQDFTNPVEYTVTAADNSTQIYIVTLVVIPSDTDIVNSDKSSLLDSSIVGSNIDLFHVTSQLSLPSVGKFGSNIIWESSDQGVVSNDGQTIVRPLLGSEDKAINLTATLTKGLISDTKVFTIAVLANTLDRISITTPADKLKYKVGEVLDISGLVITGSYSDNSSKIETVTNENISGFNSLTTATDQVLTITIGDKTATFLINIIANVVYGGGGGSSSGSSGSSFIPVINSSQKIIEIPTELKVSKDAILLTPTIPVVTKPILNFSKVLKFRTISSDVKLLQIYLNNHGYPIAKSGLGSLNHETNYFGSLTKLAVIEFQKVNQLKADGIVGSKTIEKMK